MLFTVECKHNDLHLKTHAHKHTSGLLSHCVGGHHLSLHISRLHFSLLRCPWYQIYSVMNLSSSQTISLKTREVNRKVVSPFLLSPSVSFHSRQRTCKFVQLLFVSSPSILDLALCLLNLRDFQGYFN